MSERAAIKALRLAASTSTILAVPVVIIGLAGSAAAVERQPNVKPVAVYAEHPVAVDAEHSTKAKEHTGGASTRDCIPFDKGLDKRR